MRAAELVAFWWSLQISVILSSAIDSPPHIIIIMADDLGWNDVSFHGSDQFQTPNIDALAYSGVILKDYYTQPICTPSRAALLTGRHPISNGMEDDVIYAPQPWGLPLTEQILPQYLRPLGYVSRAVGKWHLGFFHSNYTPARRGFDSHYGIWLGHQNHFTHMSYEPHPGFDFHRDLYFVWDAKEHYSVDLFTKEAESIIQDHNTSRPLFLYLAHTTPHAPLQAPAYLFDRFSYIPDKRRQKFAAMVTSLDESVGRVMTALKDNNMLNNSLVLFLTDNGGATHGFNGNVASNWPLRGGKDTLWEGGVRGVGLVWSPLLKGTPRVHHGLVNVQDWLPTLLEATGEKAPRHIDGVSQWSALQQRGPPPYTTMLHNSDPRRRIAALRHGDWKLVTGRTYNGHYDGFYGFLHGKVPYDLGKIRQSAAGKAVSGFASLPEDGKMLSLRADATVSCTPRAVSASVCQPHRAPCLFNLKDDPCEKRNLAVEFPNKLRQMISMWHTYHPVRPNNKSGDPRSYPEHWNNTWTTWMDFI